MNKRKVVYEVQYSPSHKRAVARAIERDVISRGSPYAERAAIVVDVYEASIRPEAWSRMVGNLKRKFGSTGQLVEKAAFDWVKDNSEDAEVEEGEGEFSGAEAVRVGKVGKAPPSPPSGFGKEKTREDYRKRIDWEAWAAAKAREDGHEAVAQGHDMARADYITNYGLKVDGGLRGLDGVSKGTRKGTRVRFSAHPGSLVLYSRHPEVGEEGTVGTMPGFGKRTYLPGPGGGLLYVDWDDSGMIGVSPNDVEKVR